MEKDYRLKIDEDLADNRIDRCIAEFYEELSRSYIQKLIKDERVFVNGKPVKANYKCRIDDIISFTTPDLIIPDIVPEKMDFDILYEDDSFLIVNKPKGMVVHPAPGHYTGTLVNGLMYYLKDNLSGINGVMRPGIVHRIDMDTTGSLVICKNDEAHRYVADLLRDHSLTRKYVAIVHGVIKEDSGKIDAPIGRHRVDRKKMAIDYSGRRAVTNYRVIKRFKGYTYVECELETGRTHQIRVHMASINHPVAGDNVYCTLKSQFKLQGQALHAKTIGFVHPDTKEYFEVEAPIPEYMNDILAKLEEI